MGDISKTIRAKLVAESSITSLVSTANIRVTNAELPIASKEIVLKEIPAQSNPVLDAEFGQMTVIVFVTDDVDQPFKTAKQIVAAILAVLNKKNENLRDSDTAVRWFIKSGADYVYNPDEKYWMATINFDYVEGGITD